MPFLFRLPTTSAFCFSTCLTSDSHPSLPLAASSRRGIVRATLKQHKRLTAAAQTLHLATVAAALDGYLPYLLAIADAATDTSLGVVVVKLQSVPLLHWRPTVSDGTAACLPRRVRVDSLALEVVFALFARATVHSLQARAAIHPLFDPSTCHLDDHARTAAVMAANTHLLAAAAIFDRLAQRTAQPKWPPCCPDVAPSTLRALSMLALAEATALVVLRDDPYPAVVAQERNKIDREWMYKAPSIPKVRAHLLARLSLAAAEHAASASSLLRQPTPAGAGPFKVSDALVSYVDSLRRACRAKACRFFGVDADLGGQTGIAISWLRAGLCELGELESCTTSSVLGLSKLKKEWAERREDRRVEQRNSWGNDAGRVEEMRVVHMLERRWTNVNDTVMAQPIPPTGPLLAQMPLGRNIHKISGFIPPAIDRADLDALRAPPSDRPQNAGDEDSSEGEILSDSRAFNSSSGRVFF